MVKLLALEPTQRLHREYLLDLLWPDLAPPAAANNLHQALHAARRALAGADADGLLELRDNVVALRAGGLVEVDAARFRAQAQAALDGGDLDGLCAADTSYPGELLPEDPYEPWTRGPREELHALHRDVLVRLGDRLRAAGRLAEAEAALDRALARDPMHEPALRVLLRVLAEQGRRSTALLRYERARDDLRSAYGTGTDPETRRLYRDLLVGSASTDAAEPGDSLAARRHNLLPAVTSFVGRERELAQVHRLLQRDFGPDFALDRTNAAAVVEICRRLDGMPLAIELAAARTAHLEPAEIAERLGDALSVLGRPGTATRHATLRAALEWSHDLLAPAEQCLLRRLAVFEGGCTLAAAERVCAGGPVPREAVLDVLGRLVDKSLVQVDRRDGRSRYRLLDTVRQLAAERLARAGETGTLRDAHSRFFRELAAGQDPDRSIGTAGERPAGLDVEHDDLRAALAHGLTTAPNDALALAASLWRFWITRGHYIEGADWLGRALAAAPDDGQLRAEALRGLAVLEIRLGRVGRATELARESASLPAVLAAPEPQVVFARLLSGFFSWVTSDLDTAAAVAQESAVAATRLRRPELEAAAHWLAGLTALFREDAGRAEQELADCLDRLARVDPGLPPFLPGASVCMSPMAVGRSWAPVFEETALLGGRVGPARASATCRALSGPSTGWRFDRRPRWRRCRRRCGPSNPSTTSPASPWRSTTSAASSATSATRPRSRTWPRRCGCGSGSGTGGARR